MAVAVSQQRSITVAHGFILPACCIQDDTLRHLPPPTFERPLCCLGMHSPAVNGNGRSRRQEHWPQEELQKGFKTMQLFRGVLRVNASDKTQAYATLKGLSADIFIKVWSFPAMHRCLSM